MRTWRQGTRCRNSPSLTLSLFTILAIFSIWLFLGMVFLQRNDFTILTHFANTNLYWTMVELLSIQFKVANCCIESAVLQLSPWHCISRHVTSISVAEAADNTPSLTTGQMTAFIPYTIAHNYFFWLFLIGVSHSGAATLFALSRELNCNANCIQTTSWLKFFILVKKISFLVIAKAYLMPVQKNVSKKIISHRVKLHKPPRETNRNKSAGEREK